MAGRASRGASSAFCLLHRLGELAPNSNQIKLMLDHGDSPYIRAVALLYLRYVANPRTLWSWFEAYLKDGEELSLSPAPAGGEAKKVTLGLFARELLLDPFYFETIFPRIPKPVADDFEGRLRALGLATRAVGNAGLGGPSRRGGAAQPSSVKSALMVSLAPNQRGRGGGGSGGGPSSRRERSRSPHRGGVGGGGWDRERDRRRDGDRGESSPYRRRSRSRSRSRSPSYHHRRRDDDRDFRGRDRGRDDRDSRDYRGGGGYYNDRR